MTTGEIAQMLGGTLVGDGGVIIRGMAKIESAGPSDLSFVANVKYLAHLETTRAGAVLVAPGVKAPTCTAIEVNDPYFSFLLLLERFHPRTVWLDPGVHPTAVVAPDARLGENVSIGAFSYVGPRSVVGAGTQIFPHAVIGADVQIGDHCEIHSHTSLREGVRLGNRVVVQDGAVIGSDGFGFAPTPDGYRKVPQLGVVQIADDVEIGANTTIDRATLGETTIGRGTKLDNLIQVAHNVTIGTDTVIAAQTGISGSAHIGDRCQIGGQAGIVGHVKIGNRVGIAAKAGVPGNIGDDEIYSGTPARPHALWKRIEASLTRLPDLFKRVRELEMAVMEKKPRDKATS
jgi:UDP-3-O-[3-hydroxymyristoyl] glucosamine N-acyltransferase